MPAAHEYYDSRQARSYDQDREHEAHWQVEDSYVREFMARRENPGNILDAPIGTGRFIEHYSRGTHVTGADASSAMLDVTRDRLASLGLGSNVELAVADLMHMPFEDRSFDTVICWRFLHLVEPGELAPVLTELARVTRGTLLVQVYERGAFLQRLHYRLRSLPARWWRKLQLKAAPWNHIPAYFHSKATIMRAVERSGMYVEAEDVLCAYQGNRVSAYHLRTTPAK